EYVWLDGFADMDTLQVRTAREVSTDTPSTQWEAVEGTARELTCAEDCELVYVEQDGYRVASMKDFHSCAEEGGCGAVYFVGVKDGQAVCVIGIFIS
ncbi:MAG: hypothetical protein IJY09_00175, partial [Lachnospiraceae bacterium]|nr:hypothetical protein [Lachnospiraceae bacterium]